jgi:hypothetical protein|tara:strand:+ start:3042 stop:3608 length:567 start_codon:yes stop_codon:yes gene_type:complete
MAREEGLKPISNKIKIIVDRLKKEREERRKKNKSPRKQPKLPGMMSGGMAGLFGKRKNVEAGEPEKKKRKNIIKENTTKKQKRLDELRKELGMKKGGKITQKDIDKTEEGVMIILEKKAAGGITGKTTFGELSKRKPLKKGIRLKGKGSSFMKEYKKRVYNRAGGGSMNGGVKGTGIAVKGTNFKGVF